jgi:hypothetical protein
MGICVEQEVKCDDDEVPLLFCRNHQCNETTGQCELRVIECPDGQVCSEDVTGCVPVDEPVPSPPGPAPQPRPSLMVVAYILGSVLGAVLLCGCCIWIMLVVRRRKQKRRRIFEIQERRRI